MDELIDYKISEECFYAVFEHNKSSFTVNEL